MLTLVTLGIYGVYWHVVTFEDLKKHGGVGPGGLGVLLFLVPGAGLVFLFLLPGWIGSLNEQDGLEPDTSTATGFWPLLPVIGSFVWLARVQNTLNRHWQSHGVTR